MMPTGLLGLLQGGSSYFSPVFGQIPGQPATGGQTMLDYRQLLLDALRAGDQTRLASLAGQFSIEKLLGQLGQSPGNIVQRAVLDRLARQTLAAFSGINPNYADRITGTVPGRPATGGASETAERKLFLDTLAQADATKLQQLGQAFEEQQSIAGRVANAYQAGGGLAPVPGAVTPLPNVPAVPRQVPPLTKLALIAALKRAGGDAAVYAGNVLEASGYFLGDAATARLSPAWWATISSGNVAAAEAYGRFIRSITLAQNPVAAFNGTTLADPTEPALLPIPLTPEGPPAPLDPLGADVTLPASLLALLRKQRVVEGGFTAPGVGGEQATIEQLRTTPQYQFGGVGDLDLASLGNLTGEQRGFLSSVLGAQGQRPEDFNEQLRRSLSGQTRAQVRRIF